MTLSPNLQKFLALIGWSEGADYNTIVTGVDGPETFTDYSDHPFAHREPKLVRENPPLYSTASGRYQILYRFWKVYKEQLALPDFSPASQDAVAVQMIKERHALDDVANGNIEAAILACGSIWASFPNNSYGQGGHTMDVLLERWQEMQT